MSDIKKIQTPLSDNDIMALKAGDNVLITGPIYTARDAAHKKLVELLAQNEQLPVDFTGHLIYYVGPSPAREGNIIGSAGPTTSTRMDKYAPDLLKAGSKGMLGKGEMGANVQQALSDYNGVYFAVVGGAAALVAKSIKNSEIVAYEELGTEAIRRLEVEDFPAIVAQDSHGGNFFKQGREQYKKD